MSTCASTNLSLSSVDVGWGRGGGSASVINIRRPTPFSLGDGCLFLVDDACLWWTSIPCTTLFFFLSFLNMVMQEVGGMFPPASPFSFSI